MKKLLALFSVMLINTYLLFALPTPEPSEGPNNSGPWNPDAVENSMNFPYEHDNDYSYDFSTGEYKAFVICELTVQNYCGGIYLGWLNPDGSKVIKDSHNMTFKVQGGNGWKFEANGQFGQDPGTFSTDIIAYSYNETANAKSNNVFISGSQWFYNGTAVQSGNFFGNMVGGDAQAIFTLSGSLYTFGGVTVAPKTTYGGAEYDIMNTPEIENNDAIKGLWQTGNNGCSNCPNGSNACSGEGTFTLVPGTVWAAPDATEGFYTFPVYINVDYLTFDNQEFYKDYKTTNINADPSKYVFGNAGLPTP